MNNIIAINLLVKNIVTTSKENIKEYKQNYFHSQKQ